jgi:hypothetical protein
VTVFVNPLNPHEAVLDKTWRFPWFLLLGGLVFSISGLAFFFVGLEKILSS